MKAAITTTIKKLLTNYDEESFIRACENFVNGECGCPISPANRRSWADCFRFLKANLDSPELEKYPILFEYLMVDSEKRPDVIILCEDKVVILEFKQKNEVKKADIAQAAEYRKDISYFHSQTAYQGLSVESYLVYTVPNTDRIDFPHLTPSDFQEGLKRILTEPMSPQKAWEWLNSIYEPLPNIADATARLFQTGELPNIKSIREGHIQDCLRAINEIAGLHQRSIIFVEGVPGAGKTLVGIKTVYDTYTKDPNMRPLYLSGNGPLVNILQNSLSITGSEGKAFIQGMHTFKRNHDRFVPVNNLLVFDEAQRAWDEKKNCGISEPEALLRMLSPKQSVTLICLIGKGQAIYTGEEIGMPLWQDALNKIPGWNVYLPQSLANTVYGQIDNRLFLDTSIRNDFVNVSPLVEAMLDCQFEKAREIYLELVQQGLMIYLTQKPDVLHEIVQLVKSNNPKDHVGILVSSYANKKELFPVGYSDEKIPIDKSWKWYSEESEQLTKGASEFTIQGIELEWPIVTFGGDIFLQNGKWVISNPVWEEGKTKFSNFSAIIKNIYRVLLTRSRKGMYLYIPHEKNNNLLETWQTLSKVFNM